jgi:predicted ATPase
VSEIDLHSALEKLVDAEILYQRGTGEQARYFFKHALIQDTAYQSLLKSTRQQYHQQIAQILEERFPDTKNNQPELLAHHYTEAGLREQAIPYWQTAGEQAVQRSAHAEAISHLTTALTLLKMQPDTPERAQHELTLQLMLGMPMTQTIGYGLPEVESVYARALTLCGQVGETSQLFPTLHGLYSFYSAHAELHAASEVSQQLLSFAQRTQDPLHLVQAHHNLASMLCCRGEFVLASQHLEQGIAKYGSQQRPTLATLYVGIDPGVACLYWMAWVRWHLGYPEQALKSIHEALSLAQDLSHPHNTAVTLILVATVHQFRREPQRVRELAEAAMTIATDQGFPLWLAFGTMLRGWALTEQGQVAEGKAQIQQGLAAYRAAGAELWLPYFLALLAHAYGKDGQIETGLSVLAEALETVSKTDERWYEAELYRLKGELLLNDEPRMQNEEQQTKEEQQDTIPIQHLSFSIHRSEEAEACFLKAIEIARKQQAKSLELRAVMSLARLWQQQDKEKEAHRMLSEIYNWFTEGFDTKDLQEARALIEELSHREIEPVKN